MSLAVVFSIIAMLLWATSNFIDKVLLSRFAKEGAVTSLMVFSGLIGVVAAPVYLAFDLSALSLAPEIAGALFVAGLLNVIGIWCYLYALNEDDASTVVPFMQLIPVFVLIFAFFILGESLTSFQLLMGGVVVLGGMLLSIDLKTSRIKWAVALWMVASAIFWALYEVIFKYFSLEQGFFITGFWQSLSLIAIALAILAFKKQRDQFLSYVRESGMIIFGANASNEVVNITGNAFYTYATLFAPIALVALTHAYQGVVVFIIGLLLTLFAPFLIREDLSLQVMAQKLFAIVLMGVASLYLFT